jgi:hypothetical protein
MVSSLVQSTSGDQLCPLDTLIGELQGFPGKFVYLRFSAEVLEVLIIRHLRLCKLKMRLSCCHVDAKLQLPGITGPNHSTVI